DDKHVRRALGRAQLLDWREFRVRVPRVIGDKPGPFGRGDRQMRTMLSVFAAHCWIVSLAEIGFEIRSFAVTEFNLRGARTETLCDTSRCRSSAGIAPRDDSGCNNSARRDRTRP